MPLPDGVRAKNRIHSSDRQSCSADAPPVMITDHVPAVRLPPDHATSRMAAAVSARGVMEDRRDLILRHQLAILQRRQPRRPNLNWADRGLLATLLSVIPTARRQGLRLLVTPDTILRWHRNIVRRRWAVRPTHHKDRPPGHPPEHQGPGPPASPAKPRMGLPQDPRGTGRSGSASLGIDGVGDFEEDRNLPRTAADRAGLVAVPALPG